MIQGSSARRTGSVVLMPASQRAIDFSFRASTSHREKAFRSALLISESRFSLKNGSQHVRIHPVMSYPWASFSGTYELFSKSQKRLRKAMRPSSPGPDFTTAVSMSSCSFRTRMILSTSAGVSDALRIDSRRAETSNVSAAGRRRVPPGSGIPSRSQSSATCSAARRSLSPVALPGRYFRVVGLKICAYQIRPRRYNEKRRILASSDSHLQCCLQ